MSNFLSKNLSPQYSKALPADVLSANVTRQVFKSCYSEVNPIKQPAAEFVHISEVFVKELSLSNSEIYSCIGVFSGSENVNGFKPYAMCYGGHQFGHWAGQLGDGRAINIAEADIANQNWIFQLKGAGPTPYSRGGDGLAVLRSSIREYLCSEAMHYLGVPTTRALCLLKTGHLVTRDILYNGNPKNEQGAIVCRVSSSFIRFGSFEIFSARKDKETLTTLLDFTIKSHFSHIGSKRDKATYLQFFEEVVNRTLELIIHWQRVGFVHGVMNTDNMSILGLTIDYGPYGWLEDYDPNWTPNTTDAQHRRYRFDNQPNVALWNLAQLANALYPLFEEVEPLQEILNKYKADFRVLYHKMMYNKLGIFIDSNADDAFIEELQNLMAKSELDMTIFFREISSQYLTNETVLSAIHHSSYKTEPEIIGILPEWIVWIDKYVKAAALEKITKDERLIAMKKINPKYVLRNYMAQLAIDEAEKGHYDLIDELYHLLLAPYDEQPDMEKWFAKRPDWAKHKVGCSMLSCSS